ncbi:MAG: hypothetical protein LBU09_05435 [Endomicrobium sp.]|jgi:hypothetical protein|nr:hypothetical protein [Endomicrobium sp.]
MIFKNKINKIISSLTSLFLLFANLSLTAYASALLPQYAETAFYGQSAVSRSIGKISAGTLFGDLQSQKRVIINIQDLHCNPEVQKNIAAIISEIDEKYGIDQLYSEGAYRDSSTSWVNAVGEGRKKALLEALVNSGRFTGSEYFCAVSGSGRVIKGIENFDEYSSNMVRFGRILEKQEYYKKQTANLEKELLLLSNKYLSPENKKFNRLLKLRKDGKISETKYYATFVKYAERTDATFGSVIKNYALLKTAAQSLNAKKAAEQMSGLIAELQAKIPFSTYKELSQKTGNFSSLGDFYDYAPSVFKKYAITLDSRPQLKAFFDYARLENEVEVLDVPVQEKRLISQIRQNISKDASELEISFALDFYDYFKDYLSASISADDYEYFAKNFETFRRILGKYSYENILEDLKPGIEEIKLFYETNFKRDGIFASRLGVGASVSESKQQKSKAAEISSLNGGQISEILKNSKISIVVTGGFHSQGLQKIFEDRNVSHIIITPRVSKFQNSNEVYTVLAKRQAERFERLAANKAVLPHRPETARDLTAESLTPQNADFENRALARKSAIALALGSSDVKIELKNNAVVASLNGESVVFIWDEKSQNFNFNADSVKSVSNLAANTRQRTEIFSEAVLENIRNYFEILRNALSFGANEKLFFKAMEKAAAFGADKGFFIGYGLIFEIAQNENLRKIISRNPNISIAQLACLPQLFQEIIAQNACIQELRKQHAQNPVISAVLDSPEFENYVLTYKFLTQGKEEIHYSVKNGTAEKHLLRKIALISLTLGIMAGSTVLFPFLSCIDASELVRQRALMFERVPSMDSIADAYFYMDNIYDINERIAGKINSLLNGKILIEKDEIEFYQVINYYQNWDFSKIAGIVNDNSKDMRLRLFALLQLKRNETDTHANSHRLYDFSKNFLSNQGEVKDSTEKALIEEFKRSMISGSFSIDNDFHMKASVFGTYLMWLSVFKDIPGFEDLPKDNVIYGKINKSVIVKDGKKILANSALIFSYSKKDGGYFISHEIFHNILMSLSKNIEKPKDLKKSYGAMQEFFAYLGEVSFGAELLEAQYSYYKDEKKFFLFRSNPGFDYQTIQQVGRGMSNFYHRVFVRLNKEYGISLNWKTLAEAIAYFTVSGADYSMSQPEVFRVFTEKLIEQICNKHKLNIKSVRDIFIDEDAKTANSAAFFEEISFITPGVYFFRPEFLHGKNLVNAGWRSGGHNVWIQKGLGKGLVIFCSQAPQEEVMKDFFLLIRQDAKIKSSQKTVKRIRKITGVNLESDFIDENSAGPISAEMIFIPLTSIENDVKSVLRRKIPGFAETGSILSAA